MILRIVFLLLAVYVNNSIFAQTILFNDSTLDGWMIYGTEKWYVENNELVCESGPDKQYGYLATEKDFKDFELSLEFKQESDGNSGIFFHCSIEGTRITGWQAEVAPAGNPNTGGIYESYGRGWLIKPNAEKTKFLKENDWNKMVVRVIGNEVSTWLNGEHIVSYADEKIGATQGKIALQIHDGGGVKLRWRNIILHPL
jgi:hypothetical protein